MGFRAWPALRCAVILALIILVTTVRAGASTSVSFTGLSLNGEYVYSDHVYHRVIHVGQSVSVAQADFFPPDDWPCIWIRSTLISLEDPVWHSIKTIDYCGGVGWRHWIIEPQCCEWHRWAVEVGLQGQFKATDTLWFFVRRGD